MLSSFPPHPLIAQQTGSISGRVTATDGSLLPGVTVEARSDVLPGPRVTVTGANGEYRLPALPPGSYTVKFDLSGMQSVTRKAQVQLAQDVVADATLGPGITENVTVTAESSIIDKDSASIASALSNDQILGLPAGAGVPRPAEAHPRRAVHAGHDPRSERRAAAVRTTSTSSTAST